MTTIPTEADHAIEDRLIHLITEHRLPLDELAAAMDLPLATVAEYAAQPRVMAALNNVIALANVQAELEVARYRAAAARELVRTALEGTGETQRRACADLLKFKIVPADGSSSRRGTSTSSRRATAAGMPDGPPAPALEKILETLEALGERSDDSHLPPPPPLDVPPPPAPAPSHAPLPSWGAGKGVGEGRTQEEDAAPDTTRGAAKHAAAPRDRYADHHPRAQTNTPTHDPAAFAARTHRVPTRPQHHRPKPTA